MSRGKRGINLDDLAFGSESASVYVIEAGEFAVKIGVSNDPAARARTLQTSQDREVRVFWAVRLSRVDAYAVEARFHKMLRGTSRHMRGEWYAISAFNARSMIEEIIDAESVKSMPDLKFGWDR